MKKSILETGNLLPIAAGFLLLPNFVFAQNAEQVKKIKESSNLKQLNLLQKGFSKSTLSVKELQAKAKDLKIPFMGEANGKLYQLQGFDKKGRALYYITYNTGAAEGTGTSKLHPSAGVFNLEGSGMKVHEWDGGKVRATHQEFGGRVTQKDVPLSNSDHATHVAGTMVASGVDALVKGMAPKATLDAYDWNNDENEMVAAAAAGAILSNHSYGYLGGFEWGNWSGTQGWHWFGSDEDTEYKGYGQYTAPDRDWDLIALNAPYYLPVKAAGNPRGDGPAPGETHYVRDSAGQWMASTKVRQRNGGDNGFDCIIFGSTGKNILTVGAANKIVGGYKTPQDVRMASFSAFGPVDDGRIKPDISGVGVDLKSSVSTGDTAYGTMSGTSMASPNVTGSLLLLQEHYFKKFNAHMKSATLKALAIATANEAGEAPGPDYASGWGLLNAFDAAKTISLNGKYSLIQENTLNNGTQTSFDVVAAGGSPLKVTVVWADPAPSTLSNEEVLNDRSKMLVNDLDVRVIKDGVEVLPWRLNPDNPAAPAVKMDNDVDNVEQVVIENPEAGATYTIVVKHKGDLKKNEVSRDNKGNLIVNLVPATSQDYSLVVTGVNNGVRNNLAVTGVKVTVPPLQYTASTPISFRVENKGKDAYSAGAKLSVKLVNKDNSNEVVATGELDVPSIAPADKTFLTHHFDLSKSFVNYSVEAELVYAADEISLDNKLSTSAYGIVADLTPDMASHKFGFEDDFNKNGWTSEDKDADGKTWRKYDDKSLAYEGNSFALNFPGEKTDVDDWFFSNPLKLKKDVLYRVVFYARKFQNFTEAISISLGNNPNSSSMTKELTPRVEATGKYNRYFYEFKVPTDQVAYIGFRHKTEGTDKSYAFAMDNVKFEYAESKPNVDFSADKVQANSYETVSFKNATMTASTLPVSSWEWTFAPNTVTFKDGTSTSSEAPKVSFAEGTYSVTLKAKNDKGEEVLTKNDYITVKNTPTVAGFISSAQEIFEGEAVLFANTSTGNPEPNQFEWTITPSDGVEFTGTTTAFTDKDLNVKFTKKGLYKVSLKATSEHNSDTVEKTDYINVKKVYNSVDDLTHNFDKTNNLLTLKWQRPNLNPIYKEGFEDEDGNAMPSGMTVIGQNSILDWYLTGVYKKSGEYGVRSYSWYVKSFDADNILITPKLRKGAEVLSFNVWHKYNERYDVYVVEAPASGNAPTAEEVKAGHKVYTFEATGTNPTFKLESVNIKNYTNKDFFVAFHHRTKKDDNGFILALDDIEVGYDNSVDGKVGATVGTQTLSKEALPDFKADFLKGDKLVTREMLLPETSLNSGIGSKVSFGISTVPHLVGYEVVKDGTKVSDINDYNTRLYNETMTQNGTYTYDVYAVYSDGVKSDKQTVVVNITTLATSEVDANTGLKVYPNPSNGNFVVEAVSTVSALKASVYDMSGKQILSNEYKGNRFELNLTQQPKGVYILNLVDDKGVKHNVKLMVK
ncbi:S8 family serine peptidase [Riemerella anatipestifer]|uniref:S8 family serine peptidase n=1 Tax=Riemerella anatipestifer TaxID=34085 RepID=UPI001BDA6B81|nr:S8 family serine peptidase [Riemerella anatipestifer]MBT0571966.1 S8 family serine peptidase [Riemerella anatipestifer]MCU7569249.1 S8 family serine peptidase [Riemerella anatipestifer]